MEANHPLSGCAVIALDLFSGAGGFTTGAQLAGARVVWAANHWPDAVACHAANHPAVEHVTQDLAEMDWCSCPDADLLLASPACQGHSQAGQPARAGTGGSHRPDPRQVRRQGQRDRNTAYAVLAAADTLRPRSIVVENVVDFMRWAAFGPWCDMLRSFGYAVHADTLNGLHFGGAQDRPRCVITAQLDTLLPVKLDRGSARAARCIGDCLDHDEEHPDHRWCDVESKPERMRTRIRQAQHQAGPRCFWANVSEARGRDWCEPFPTATTKSAGQWTIVDGDRCRIINPRELARSMSFPDTYRFPPQRALAGRLIGNAIDVNLARAIAAQVMAA